MPGGPLGPPGIVLRLNGGRKPGESDSPADGSLAQQLRSAWLSENFPFAFGTW